MTIETNADEKQGYSRRRFLRASGVAVVGATVATSAEQSALVAAELPSRKIRIGVVGGRFGRSFFWHQHPDCVVEAVSDLIDERRVGLMKTYQCTKSYPSLEKLILDKNIDAVAVFTGAPDHVRHCVAVMRAGKHVISAVPAATSMADAQKLADTVKETGLTYMMAETSYYYQPAITARKWFQDGKFGDIFYTEAEYQHPLPQYPRKGSLAVDQHGNKTWRYGFPPMWYPTHSTSLLIGTTGERLTEVTCLGWKDGMEVQKDNVYDNPFFNAAAFFKTDRGHGLRVSEFRYGAVPPTVRAKWYGTQMSLVMGHRHEPQTYTLTSRDKSSKDEAGFSYQDPLGEEYEEQQWWKTDMLPEPLRHGQGGHDHSHPFLTHEFIDALVHDRKPAIDIRESLAYTVPGLVAHESALQGGKQMEIPQL